MWRSAPRGSTPPPLARYSTASILLLLLLLIPLLLLLIPLLLLLIVIILGVRRSARVPSLPGAASGICMARSRPLTSAGG